MPDLFLITSVIYTDTTKGWSYCPVKSYYTPSERYNQTLKTISTIRDKCPTAHIVLLEGGKLSVDEEIQFKSLVEYYFNYSDNLIIKEKVDSMKKGWGEVAKVVEFLQTNYELCLKYERIFKISGRYWLSDTFNYADFSPNQYSFRRADEYQVSTVLYAIPRIKYSLFLVHLKEIDRIYSTEYGSFERFIYPYLVDVNWLSKLGVQGLIAVCRGEHYEF